MTDNRIGRLMFEKQLDAKLREAQHEAANAMVHFLRQFVLQAELTPEQVASAEVLCAAYPDQWAEAQRQGPLGERRCLSRHAMH